MRAGWKNRIEERRYFEAKREAWRERVTRVAILRHQMACEESIRKIKDELTVKRSGCATSAA